MSPRVPPTAPPRRAFLIAAGAAAFASAARGEGRAPAGPSPQAVLERPEAYDPFTYASVVQWLWGQGRRQQAAFWFYVFQARTRPWALADTRGDSAAALRASLNEALGTVINAWVASDLAAWRALAERAVAYERRLPLSPERPAGLDAASWGRLVEQARSDYASQLRSAFDGLSPETFAAQRRAGGLSVGPWAEPGPPLLAAWR